jgi:hypothetical protein
VEEKSMSKIESKNLWLVLSILGAATLVGCGKDDKATDGGGNVAAPVAPTNPTNPNYPPGTIGPSGACIPLSQAIPFSAQNPQLGISRLTLNNVQIGSGAPGNTTSRPGTQAYISMNIVRSDQGYNPGNGVPAPVGTPGVTGVLTLSQQTSNLVRAYALSYSGGGGGGYGGGYNGGGGYTYPGNGGGGYYPAQQEPCVSNIAVDASVGAGLVYGMVYLQLGVYGYNGQMSQMWYPYPIGI